MPAATPPPPVGQPIGQPEYPPAYSASYPAAQAPATRSTGKFVAGIILTVVGGLWALSGFRNVAIAAASFGDNPGYAVGYGLAGVLIPAALLAIGIVLIVRSKPKVQ